MEPFQLKPVAEEHPLTQSWTESTADGQVGKKRFYRYFLTISECRASPWSIRWFHSVHAGAACVPLRSLMGARLCRPCAWPLWQWQQMPCSDLSKSYRPKSKRITSDSPVDYTSIHHGECWTLRLVCFIIQLLRSRYLPSEDNGCCHLVARWRNSNLASASVSLDISCIFTVLWGYRWALVKHDLSKQLPALAGSNQYILWHLTSYFAPYSLIASASLFTISCPRTSISRARSQISITDSLFTISCPWTKTLRA